MKTQFCTPELPVSSVGGAMTALRKLGFRDAWTYEDSFGCMFGDGDVEIFLRKESRPHPCTLYFKVDDADAFYDLYKQHSDILEPIHDTQWGMREFAARVTDNHIFRIGHGLPQGADRRAIAQAGDDRV